MSPFQQLYEYCQTLPFPPHIDRPTVRAKAEELTNTKVKILIGAMDTNVVRGVFFAANNVESPFVCQAGGKPVIVIARGLNRCWERFVQVKEMMHLFDRDDEQTRVGEELDILIDELVSPISVDEPSNQLRSEGKAIWMALACLCPEKVRLQFLKDVERKHLDHYAVAKQLRIPEKYVPLLLEPRFTEVIAHMM